MRIDLFLKLSRLCLRRTVAQELCDAGLVKLNGQPVKSAHSVKPGDVIELRIRNRKLTVRVIGVPTARSVSKATAASLYELIKEEKIEDRLLT
jgi:ribosomal 50S subunit-recycling heat shock protein